jgi:hypothetical protein
VCVAGGAVILFTFKGLREARIEGSLPVPRGHGAAAAAARAAAATEADRPAVATR